MNATLESGEKVAQATRSDHQEFLADIILEAAFTSGIGPDKLPLLVQSRRELLGHLVISLREFFKDAESRSQQSSQRYYPKFKPRTIEEQVRSLCKRFPHLKQTVATVEDQPGTDGLFAIPNPLRIGDNYHDATLKVFALMKRDRYNQFNYNFGRIDSNHMRQNSKTAEMFSAIAEQQQGNDIIVLPCQLGKTYVGKAPQDAIARMAENEFPFNSYMGGIILSTHANRMLHDTEPPKWTRDHYTTDLGMDLPGDEMVATASAGYEVAAFSFAGGILVFGSRKKSASQHFGTASGFFPILKS